MSTLSQTIVEKIIDDLTNRKGLDSTWDELDDDLKEEIKQEWEEIIENSLDEEKELDDAV